MRNNLRYAFRVLRHDTGFTVTAVLTLALGIGAATTIFSVVNTVLLRPLAYRDPDGLVLVRERIRKITPELLAVPPPDVFDFQNATAAFTQAAGWLSDERDLSNDGGQPIRTPVARTTANAFELLGVQPALGRTFTATEDRERRPVAVLSHSLWRTRFASDPAILGRTILLDRVPHTIIGVMRADFVFPPPGLRASTPASVWVPMAFTRQDLESVGDMFNDGVVARLRPGVSLDRANEVLAGVAQRIHEKYPPEARNEFALEAVAVPLRDEVVGKVRTLVWLLAGAVLFLLLIACGNVANLLVSRAAAREREFAIRAAVGAGRASIAGQWLAESLLVAGAAGALGILLALYGTDALARLTALNIPRLSEVHVDWRVLSASVVLSMATALLFGAVPVLFTVRINVIEALKEGGRSSDGRGRNRVRSMLVISELAVVLLAAAGAASVIPARRALGVDPMTALRRE